MSGLGDGRGEITPSLQVSKETVQEVEKLKRSGLSIARIARETAISEYVIEAILAKEVIVTTRTRRPTSPPPKRVYEPSLAEIWDERLQAARQRRAEAGRAYAEEAFWKVYHPDEISSEDSIRRSMEFLASLDPE